MFYRLLLVTFLFLGFGLFAQNSVNANTFVVTYSHGHGAGLDYSKRRYLDPNMVLYYVDLLKLKSSNSQNGNNSENNGNGNNSQNGNSGNGNNSSNSGNGNSGTNGNNDSCELQNKIINYIYENSTSNLKDFSKVKNADLVLTFEDNGIIVGDFNGYFNPENNITLPEFLKVSILSNCLNHRNNSGSTWENKALNFSKENGVIDTKINKRQISVSEAVKIVEKITNKNYKVSETKEVYLKREEALELIRFLMISE